MRKTKIVCTLGPASESAEVMSDLLDAGLNIARLNFSHGTHESHKEYIDRFRAVRDKKGVPAAVLLDTKGPEIRLRDFADGKVILVDGNHFTLTTKECMGDCEHVAITYTDLPRQLKKGDRVLIDDGKITLVVDSTTETEIETTVTHGGEVSNHKGVNIPGVALDMDFLSEQDKSDLLFGIEMDVDFVAASFTRTRQDIEDMRQFLNYNGGHDIKIIAKIENMQGIENFDEILEVSDGIMVARGDMAVEVPFETIPGIQKRFIRRCYQAGKMVITATQMLESMTSNPTPTRAEITDVANAVFDGTSAVMLSGESAKGMYPVEAVSVMAGIAEKAEEDAFKMDAYRDLGHDNDKSDINNAICDATCTTARDLEAKAIIAVTMHGETARKMSKFRPEIPIVAATPVPKAYHQLALSWGVYPVMARMIDSSDKLFMHAVDCAKGIGLVKDGDRVVVTAGLPLHGSIHTNTLRVIVAGEQI